MNWFVLNQFLVLYLFNIHLKSVGCVLDDLKFPSIHSATIAPPPPLVLPNPTALGKFSNTHQPYRTSTLGDTISIVHDGDHLAHGSKTVNLQLPPLRQEQYKTIGNDKSFIEQTLDKYAARHNDKAGGNDKKLEHKTSKTEGKQFHVTAKGAKGDSTKENHKKQFEDKGGKQNEDYDEKSNSDQHHKYHGGAIKSKFNKKNSDNKRRTEKGYHNKYRKNEHHKLDDFFKNYNENGDFIKYGVKNTKTNKIYKKLKKGGHKTQKKSESKSQKKGPTIVKLTIV